MRWLSIFGLGLMLGSIQAQAETATDPVAAAEIDGQIVRLAEAPPDIAIIFEPLTDSRYKLLSASFALDDQALPFDVTFPQGALFDGKIAPGPHDLTVKLVYNEAQGDGIFQYADYRLVLSGTVRVIAENGLRSWFHVIVEKHPGAPQKQRLTLGTRVDSAMLAQIDESPVVLTSHPPASEVLSSNAPVAEAAQSAWVQSELAPSELQNPLPAMPVRRRVPKAKPAMPETPLATAALAPEEVPAATASVPIVEEVVPPLALPAVEARGWRLLPQLLTAAAALCVLALLGFFAWFSRHHAHKVAHAGH